MCSCVQPNVILKAARQEWIKNKRLRSLKSVEARTCVTAGGVGGTEAAIRVRGTIGLAFHEVFASVLELNVTLRGVKGEEVVDETARHARAHLVGAEGLEPVSRAGCSIVETPVDQRSRD